jgi:hypothetical protein
MSRQDSGLLWCKWLALVSVLDGSSLRADVLPPPNAYSYVSNQPGCRADTSTEQELTINGDGQQWVIVAPARVVSTGRHQTVHELAKAPLDLEIAEPLALALQNRLARSQSTVQGEDRPSKITRIKIVSVWHGVLGLGMGKAVGQISLRFNICINGNLPEGKVPNEVARNSPKMSTLWHQPRGEELRHGFQQAADEAFSAIADLALRPID